MYLGFQSDYRVGDIRAKVRLVPGAATEVRFLLLHPSVVRFAMATMELDLKAAGEVNDSTAADL